MYKLLQIYCLVTVISGSSVFAAKIEALRDMPSQVQDLANAGEQDPNVPEDVFAQGVIAVEAAAPVVSVMSAATEVPEFK